MKAAITDGKGGLWLGDVAEPEIGSFECLVRVECCAFCNSTDRHIVDGTGPFGLSFPAILGHESVGVIEQVGRDVRHFHVGDRVLRAYAAYPDETLGDVNSAWGGFAEYAKITDWQAMGDPQGSMRYQQRVPAGIDAARAALLIPQKEVYSATAKIDPIEGRRFVVAGAGIVGLLFGLFLKRRGADHVTMVARRAEQLDRAMAERAADAVCTFEQCAEQTEPFDAMVETTGSVPAVRSLLGCVRAGGSIYAYAVYGEHREELASLAQRHDWRRIDPDEPAPHEAVCDLVRQGELDQHHLITHDLPLSDIEQAWRTVREKQTFKTLVWMPGAQPDG